MKWKSHKCHVTDWQLLVFSICQFLGVKQCDVALFSLPHCSLMPLSFPLPSHTPPLHLNSCCWVWACVQARQVSLKVRSPSLASILPLTHLAGIATGPKGGEYGKDGDILHERYHNHLLSFLSLLLTKAVWPQHQTQAGGGHERQEAAQHVGSASRVGEW